MQRRVLLRLQHCSRLRKQELRMLDVFVLHRPLHSTAPARLGQSFPSTQSPTSPPRSSSTPAAPRPFAFVPPGSHLPYVFQPQDATSPVTPTSLRPAPPRPLPRDRCRNPHARDAALSAAAGAQAAQPRNQQSSLLHSISASSSQTLLPHADDSSFPRPLPRIYVSSPFEDAGLPPSSLSTRGQRLLDVLTWTIIVLVTARLTLEGEERHTFQDGTQMDHVFTPVRHTGEAIKTVSPSSFCLTFPFHAAHVFSCAQLRRWWREWKKAHLHPTLQPALDAPAAQQSSSEESKRMSSRQ